MATTLSETQGVRIAVVGCGHGVLNSIYASVAASAELKGWDSVDLVIIGGDFQAIRNAQDLNVISMPPKYREMHDFHEYYAGIRKAPYLTIYCGGNHEASNFQFELFYGGWVAPNIYYMGAANVLRLGPLRIAGMSGIWKGFDYRKPHYERLPFTDGDIKSFYHQREMDVRKLLQIRSQVDIGLSHDWPLKIEYAGDHETLFKKKSHFKEDSLQGQLGSPAAKYVLDRLRPPYWFSAHMHVKFAAIVNHPDPILPEKANAQERHEQENQTPSLGKNDDEIDLNMFEDAGPSVPAKNEDEIDLGLDEDDEETRAEQSTNGMETRGTKRSRSLVSESSIPEDLRSQLPESFFKSKHDTMKLPFPEAITNRVTRFLALDKPMKDRDFLQLLQVEPLLPSETPMRRPFRLEYDPEWLAITRTFAITEPLVLGDPTAQVPRDKGEAVYQPLIADASEWVKENIIENPDVDLFIPENFEQTAPVFDPKKGDKVGEII
ncbi:hypothetical protein, variant 2 [Verruconis gallopava]|uniref:Lariat debranching enzyme C-terminal domain-containing protein n=1 Tax=Verruconis gallopava TaxID=253628 RepID=A0A0D2AIP4_9PEZI|nr:hypothetical protein, variant 2 [Verruconis gallopava]KIW06773.1 hypothetical protein, variant 2 [Verruconis gallopava]